MALLVAGPLLKPGYLLLRDAVSTPRSYLSDSALGLTAAIMGYKDLQAIKRGERDPRGQGQTKTGMICGLIGAILGTLFLLAACVGVVVMIANA